MKLIEMQEWGYKDESPLQRYWGWYKQTDLTGAISAFNINTLRRLAPYAYLCLAMFKDTSLEEWMTLHLGASEAEYLRLLDVVPIHVVPSPFLDAESAGIDAESEGFTNYAFLIGEGDIGGVVDLVTTEDTVLVCLPRRWSLVQLRDVLKSAADGREAAIRLLRDGGFITTVIDSVAFWMWTMDPRYRTFFDDEAPAQVDASPS